jgi:hypothetical protein
MVSVSGRDRRAEAREVIVDALSGSVSLEDFHRRWPDAGDPLIDAIFDETEDTLEHTPGSLLSGRDQERFEKSIPYTTLIVDEQLLLDDFAGVSSPRLLQIRERLFKQVALDQDDEALIGAARDFVAREVAGGAA